MTVRARFAPATHHSRGRRWLQALLAVATILLVLYLARVPIMTTMARVWIVDERPQKADAIVLLCGSADTRPIAAAMLYKKGFAPVVVFSETEENALMRMGLTPTERELNQRMLRRAGVPDRAMVVLPGPVASTRDEAVSTRRWVEEHKARRLLVVTDAFHTRRARYIFNRELRGLRVDVVPVAAPNPRYDPLRWWESEEALLFFQTELIKFLYYLVH